MPEVTPSPTAPPPPPPLTLRLFGAFDLQLGGQSLPPLRTHKGEWLLAILILRGGRPIPREWLAGVLWPDSPEVSALYNLRRCVYDIRQVLGAESGRLHAPSVRTIALDIAGADVDVVRFDHACRHGGTHTDIHALEEAISLYSGPLLPGCDAEWILAERTMREGAYLDALERLADHSLGQHNDRAAIGFLKRVIALEPLRESAYCSLMQILRRAGDSAAVTALYRDLRILLHNEINAEPTGSTQEIYNRLRDQPGDAPPSISTADIMATAGTMSTVTTVAAGRSEVNSLTDAASVELVEVEPVGGAVALLSNLYIERSTDAAFHAALARRDSIVLLKGPRQVGKTSLLTRGLQQVRASGCRVVITDLQKVDSEHLASVESFYRFLIRAIAEVFELDVPAEGHWEANRGPNENLERFLRRRVFSRQGEGEPPYFVWVLDEVDRLFTCPFGADVFALFRSWHNERAFDPGGPWGRLTMAMAYATEAHLFITDLNQSPFNVGTRLTLDDFTASEVALLNQRQASPLRGEEELRRFLDLVGGHPYLVRRGLHEMVTHRIEIGRLETIATSEAGPFTDHLQRLLFLLSRDNRLADAVRGLMEGVPPLRGDFYRLRSAGVIVGDGAEDARIRCPLYQKYLQMHLL